MGLARSFSSYYQLQPQPLPWNVPFSDVRESVNRRSRVEPPPAAQCPDVHNPSANVCPKDNGSRSSATTRSATLSLQTFLPLLLDKQDWEQAATACQKLSSTSNTSTAATSRDISPTLGLMKMEIWWREPQRTSSSHAAKS